MFLDFSDVNAKSSRILANPSLRAIARYSRLATEAARQAIGVESVAIREYNSVAQGFVDNGTYTDITPMTLKAVAASPLLAKADDISNTASDMESILAIESINLPVNFDNNSVQLNPGTIIFCGYGFLITPDHNYFNPALHAASFQANSHGQISFSNTNPFNTYAYHPATKIWGKVVAGSSAYPVSLLQIGDRLVRLPICIVDGAEVEMPIAFTIAQPTLNGTLTEYTFQLKRKNISIGYSYISDTAHTYVHIDGIMYPAEQVNRWIELTTMSQETFTCTTLHGTEISNSFIVANLSPSTTTGITNPATVTTTELFSSIASPQEVQSISDALRDAATYQ